MTVDKLIEKLKELSEQGKGCYDVCTTNQGGYSIILKTIDKYKVVRIDID